MIWIRIATLRQSVVHNTLPSFVVRACIGATVCLLFECAGAAQEATKESRPLPLSMEQAAQSFQLSQEELDWRPILSEPEIRQPVMATFDLAGRLWVVQYLQYPYPHGVKLLSRDNHWRTIYDKVPPPPLEKLEGQDILSVFQTTESGVRKEKDFIAGLNITTAVAPDLDGVWVLNPPYLLYYPDRNRDLTPDGPPEVHLEGFGLEDTHSVVNSLRFGPDGWLYAAQGSTVTGAVRGYESDQEPIRSQGQNIWRYHPPTKRYEIFAEGGGNAFGVAFDDEGRLFSGHNGGDTRGFHYEQGAYYRKGFSKHGELSNPFTYGYLMPMYQPPFPRFTHTMLLANGTQFEGLYPNGMLAVDPMHGQLIATKLIPDSATYKTSDIEVTLQSSDPWFRPVAIIDGPDGAAYTCDWYDIDIAHIHAYEGRIDRDRGRLYRLGASQAPEASWDPGLATRTDLESLALLVQKLEHPYRWQRWAAVRLLAAHPLREKARVQIIAELDKNPRRALDYLWALHACGWLDDSLPEPSDSSEPRVPISYYFKHANEHVRRWAIRLACDDGSLNEVNIKALNDQILQETSAQTLVQCAASLRRLPSEQAMQCVPGLFERLDTIESPTLNLMAWWVIERFASEFELLQRTCVDPVERWSSKSYAEEIAPRLLRRWLAMKTAIGMRNAELLLQRAAKLPGNLRSVAAKSLSRAFEDEYAGRSLAEVNDGLLQSLSNLGEPSLSLKLRQGNPQSVAEAVQAIGSTKTSEKERLQLIRIFGELPQATAQDMLVQLALKAEQPRSIREASIRALGKYDAPILPGKLIEVWSDLPQELRVAGAGLMVAKPTSARDLLAGIKDARIAKQDVPLEMVRAMRLHDSPELSEMLDLVFPETSLLDHQAAQSQVKRVADVLLGGHGDPYAGRKIYKQQCARCHKLFQTGGDIGPDLTGYQRDALDALVLNIIAPSLEIREGYQSIAIQTVDGDIHVGFVESENETQTVVKGVDGQSHVVAKNSIESRKSQIESIMPQGLLDHLSEQELRDFFAYLRSPQPIGE